MNDNVEKPKKPLRFWPGMPTPASKKVEFLFPIFLPLFVIILVLSMVAVRSCREWARDQAGQAPPLSAGTADVDMNTNP